MSDDPVREALERIRALAAGNDYVNEYELRRDFELVDDALDALERIEDGACSAHYGPGCDTECRSVAWRVLHPRNGGEK